MSNSKGAWWTNDWLLTAWCGYTSGTWHGGGWGSGTRGSGWWWQRCGPWWCPVYPLRVSTVGLTVGSTVGYSGHYSGPTPITRVTPKKHRNSSKTRNFQKIHENSSKSRNFIKIPENSWKFIKTRVRKVHAVDQKRGPFSSCPKSAANVSFYLKTLVKMSKILRL